MELTLAVLLWDKINNKLLTLKDNGIGLPSQRR